MTYAGEWLPALGPCTCQGCGELVWYAKGHSRYLGNPVVRIVWRDRDGTMHRCPRFALPAARAGGTI